MDANGPPENRDLSQLLEKRNINVGSSESQIMSDIISSKSSAHFPGETQLNQVNIAEMMIQTPDTLGAEVDQPGAITSNDISTLPLNTNMRATNEDFVAQPSG